MKDQNSAGMQIAVAIGSLTVMLALMYWSYVYPYPNGKVPYLSYFVIFWFKEIILLAMAAMVFLGIVTSWFLKFFRGKRSTDAEPM
jgi:cell division protein FtsX